MAPPGAGLGSCTLDRRSVDPIEDFSLAPLRSFGAAPTPPPREGGLPSGLPALQGEITFIWLIVVFLASGFSLMDAFIPNPAGTHECGNAHKNERQIFSLYARWEYK